MSEKPIIFSGPMVRAIIEGRKTQTRRVVKPQPIGRPREVIEWSRRVASACGDDLPNEPKLRLHAKALSGRVHPFEADEGRMVGLTCPYGAPGDTLWVREQHSYRDGTDSHPSERRIWYWADGPVPFGNWTRPTSPIFLPRVDARLTLRVTAVRVERLQEITDADVSAEGMIADRGVETWYEGKARGIFERGWDSINGKRAPWASNPWVWVVTFEKAAEQPRSET